MDDAIDEPMAVESIKWKHFAILEVSDTTG